ncbi:hypothetical protein PR048_015954 [Dryococelus australis]|uniref:Uncharacterized protein n=1 Tax=Dryococelus australis TaxID=614101 RepID=A0ABQ9HIE1_9NEOP|nr:hypothetical protein PR048_015954 [Dryococelus australis]
MDSHGNKNCSNEIVEIIWQHIAHLHITCAMGVKNAQGVHWIKEVNSEELDVRNIYFSKILRVSVYSDSTYRSKSCELKKTVLTFRNYGNKMGECNILVEYQG